MCVVLSHAHTRAEIFFPSKPLTTRQGDRLDGEQVLHPAQWGCDGPTGGAVGALGG